MINSTQLETNLYLQTICLLALNFHQHNPAVYINTAIKWCPYQKTHNRNETEPCRSVYWAGRVRSCFSAANNTTLHAGLWQAMTCIYTLQHLHKNALIVWACYRRQKIIGSNCIKSVYFGVFPLQSFGINMTIKYEFLHIYSRNIGLCSSVALFVFIGVWKSK